jgi:HAD superfamily hydrolase (TIGR01509 family)
LIAFEKTFRDLEIEFTRGIYEECYSPNWYSIYQRLDLPTTRWQQADDLWLQHYGEEPVQLVGGGRETLLSLYRKGHRMGIVSSGSRRRLTREIEELDLSTLFGVVVCNEDIVNKKPHPEGLDRAIDVLKVPRAACSYVGDAPEDIQMGRNAGVRTGGVLSSYPTSRLLKQATPDIHLESITELLLHF